MRPMRSVDINSFPDAGQGAAVRFEAVREGSGIYG